MGRSRFEPAFDNYDIDVPEGLVNDRPKIKRAEINTPDEIQDAVKSELANIIKGQISREADPEEPDILRVVQEIGPLSVSEAMATLPHQSIAIPEVFHLLEECGVLVVESDGPPRRYRAIG